MPGTYSLQSPPKEVGDTIPGDTPHAVSVTLPTWDSNVAYEEGERWVHSKLRSGYPRYISNCKFPNPRFMIHEKIQDVSSLRKETLMNSWRKYVLTDTVIHPNEQCYSPQKE